MPVPAVVLAEHAFGEHLGKAANDLVLYNDRLFHVTAIIDSTKSGRDAGEVLEAGKLGVPIVATLEEALHDEAEALILGTTPIGGKLDDWSREIIKKAITRKLDIWNGMHTFLSNDDEIRRMASERQVKIVDLRKPPSDLRIWTGDVLKVSAGIVTVMGTDCGVGKNIATVELVDEAKRRGINAGIVATGQTMLMLGADAGSVVDAVPADFTPGEVERHVLRLSQDGKELIVVEGQASVTHPGYGQVAVAILYGSQPDAVVLAHDPFRANRHGFNMEMPPVSKEIGAIELLCPKAKVVALTLLNWRGRAERLRELKSRLEVETGMPAEDPRQRIDRIFDAVAERLKAMGRSLHGDGG